MLAHNLTFDALALTTMLLIGVPVWVMLFCVAFNALDTARRSLRLGPSRDRQYALKAAEQDREALADLGLTSACDDV